MTRVTACHDCGVSMFNDPSLYCMECMVKRISGKRIDLEERTVEDGHGNVTGSTVVAVEHQVTTGDYLGRPLTWQIEHGFVSWQDAVARLQAENARLQNHVPGLSATLDEVTWERDLLLAVVMAARELFAEMDKGSFVPFSATTKLRGAVLAYERRLER